MQSLLAGPFARTSLERKSIGDTGIGDIGMENSKYAIFLAFGVLWVATGSVAVVALMKADGQPIRLGKWGLVVAVPILVPLLAAFAFAAFYH